MKITDLFEQVDQAVADVLGGNTEALLTYIELRQLAEHIDEALEQIKGQALKEGSQYHGQQYHGYEIQVREGGGRYAYDHLPEWALLKEQMKAIEKDAQNAYKLHSTGRMCVTEEGEVITPAEFKPNGPSLLFKFKK